MNPRFLAAIIALSAAVAATRCAAQDPLAGTWVGEWVRDGSRAEVTLHFTRSERGYQGRFDSETLRVAGIPLEGIKWNPPDIAWTIGGDETTITYSGQL